MYFRVSATIAVDFFTDEISHSLIKPFTVFYLLSNFHYPGDDLHLSISSNMSEEEWVGIGFSGDRFMGHDDVVAVLKDPYSDTFAAVSLINPARELRAIVLFCFNSFLDYLLVLRCKCLRHGKLLSVFSHDANIYSKRK